MVEKSHRIGYYACQWGINIKGKVDCNKLVEYTKELDDIIVSKSHAFLCTESGQSFTQFALEIKTKSFKILKRKD